MKLLKIIFYKFHKYSGIPFLVILEIKIAKIVFFKFCRFYRIQFGKTQMSILGNKNVTASTSEEEPQV